MAAANAQMSWAKGFRPWPASLAPIGGIRKARARPLAFCRFRRRINFAMRYDSGARPGSLMPESHSLRTGWSLRFEDPIPLPRGRQLVTLKDAADYITRVQKTEHESALWQAAIEALIMTAEGRGPLMHAPIGVLRAINRRKPNPAPRWKRARSYRIIR